MNVPAQPRVMWLLNHGAARRFEIAMLKRIGISEIFLPKKFPDDPAFRSASSDYTEDQHLTLPKHELAQLNEADWYRGPPPEVWEIANRYFDALFFVPHHVEIIASIARHFKGAVLLRAYGMLRGSSYSQVIDNGLRHGGDALIRSLGKRFFFAQAYPHLHLAESASLAARSLYLPLGMNDCRVRGQWRGNERKIFFICPDIGFNPYYRAVYKQFTDSFKGIPYAIGGAQPIRVNDPNILGYVDADRHERNLNDMRVMFYHSTEPNHVHYHPFEAVRAGMPLVFMAGGMLDLLGGENLPGRCTSVKQARHKIERILNDDKALIDSIRDSQEKLLDCMNADRCEHAWRAGLQRVTDALHSAVRLAPDTRERKTRIAVMVPVGYRGGSLNGAKLLAQAIDGGARAAGAAVEVVFAHLDEPDLYPCEEFADLPASIKRRPYKWQLLSREQAYRAMAYAGSERDMPAPKYQAPEDGIKQFMDCDLWVIVSDRLQYPVLPLRPYVLMVYDYLQRYQPLLEQELNTAFISAAHGAESVFVTTDFTRHDALQFAGLPERRVVKLPMLVPRMSLPAPAQPSSEKRTSPYFLWTTNLAPHKNHENAFKALSLYYGRHDGRLACCITGVNTDQLFRSKLPHLKPLRKLVDRNPALKQRLRLLGELPEHLYQAQLADAHFLWHAGWIDNGTFSVIEAGQLGVPALSSDYPAMREIDRQFGLELYWMDAHDPDNMARQLKRMETEAPGLRTAPPVRRLVAGQSVERLASAYWEAVRECL
jgi:glycosyltransferase involved in cell wall biosynthesis